MKYPILQKLSATGVAAMPESFFRGSISEVQDEFLEPFGREVDLADLDAVLREGISRHSDLREASAHKFKNEADTWLAPRVHSALRLTRAEAADPDIWAFLAMAAFPEYVFWRWGGKTGETQRTHFVGRDTKQAYKRLWWAAEISRNGPDYDLVDVAFWNTDIASTIFSLRAMHNPIVAIAVLRFMRDQDIRDSTGINALSTKLNTTAVTVSLDTLAPYPDVALIEDEDWLSDHLREIDNPVGPNSERVDEAAVSAVTALLKELHQ